MWLKNIEKGNNKEDCSATHGEEIKETQLFTKSTGTFILYTVAPRLGSNNSSPCRMKSKSAPEEASAARGNRATLLQTRMRNSVRFGFQKE